MSFINKFFGHKKREGNSTGKAQKIQELLEPEVKLNSLLEKDSYLPNSDVSGFQIDNKTEIASTHDTIPLQTALRIIESQEEKLSRSELLAIRRSISNCKSDLFLCGDVDYEVMGVSIHNPCVYTFDENNRDFCLPCYDRVAILSDDELKKVALHQIDFEKPLFEFSEEETSFYLGWLSRSTKYAIIYWNGFWARFYNGIFHRALIEGRDEYQIVQKCLDLLDANDYPGNVTDPQIKLFRFIFAVLETRTSSFTSEQLAIICERMKSSFYAIDYYYFKENCYFDPYSWYIKHGFLSIAPYWLYLSEVMGLYDFWKNRLSNPALHRVTSYATIEILLCKQMGNAMELKTVVDTKEAMIKSYKECISYPYSSAWKPLDLLLSSMSIISKDVNDWLCLDKKHYDLVMPLVWSGERPSFSSFIGFPPKYQQELKPLFFEEVKLLADNPPDTAESLLKKLGLCPNGSGKIGKVERYVFEKMDDALRLFGYQLDSEIPLGILKSKSIVSVVKEGSTKTKKSDPVFVVDRENRRIIGLTKRGYSLEKIEVPSVIDGVEINEIGPNCFSHSEHLKSVSFGFGIRMIARYAFSKCEKLENVILPESLIGIGMGAFFGCSSLKTITFPLNLKNIASIAFCDCKKLVDISFCGTMTQWNGIEKGSRWRLNVPANGVNCTNGLRELQDLSRFYNS